MTICSKAWRLSNRCGMNVRAKALRLKIRPDCRYTLAFEDFAKPSSGTGGSYQRPLDQHSR
ncbi:hypothetical protein D3C76_1487090 [compost metagenome]